MLFLKIILCGLCLFACRGKACDVESQTRLDVGSLVFVDDMDKMKAKLQQADMLS